MSIKSHGRIVEKLQTDAPLALCLAIARANGHMNRRMDGHLGALHGLSFIDFTVLRELATSPTGKLRRVDLAERLGVTQSAVTRILIPLEKIGLVNRERDARDARIGYAALTRTGREIFEEALITAEGLADDVWRAHRSELEALEAALSDFTE